MASSRDVVSTSSISRSSSSRSASTSAHARSSPPSCGRSSSATRIRASGERSSCDTLARSSFWPRTSRSMRSAISLKARVSSASSSRGERRVRRRAEGAERDAHAEVARAEAARGLGEALDRARDAAREGPRGERHHEQDEPHRPARAAEARAAEAARRRHLRPSRRRRPSAGRGSGAAARPVGRESTTTAARAPAADSSAVRAGSARPDGGDDAPVEIAHDEVDVELVVELAQPPRERGPIAEALADQAATWRASPLRRPRARRRRARRRRTPGCVTSPTTSSTPRKCR